MAFIYTDSDSCRKEFRKWWNELLTKNPPIILSEKKGNNEMENERRTMESMFRMLIDSHTYLYFKGCNIEMKNDLYSTLEFIKRASKENAFEKKERIIAKKVIELIETCLKTYDKELNFSNPETKSFNNIICDIKQSMNEKDRI